MHLTKTLFPFLLTLITFVSAVPTRPTFDEVDGSIIAARDKKKYTKPDAYKVEKIKEWMKDNVKSDHKFVFYSKDAVAWPWAKAFVEKNKSYKHFSNLFDKNYGSKFEEDFGIDDINKDFDAATNCSLAMAQSAHGDARVFNDKGAGQTSVWKTIELPALKINTHVPHIYAMKDATTDKDDHYADLKKG